MVRNSINYFYLSLGGAVCFPLDLRALHLNQDGVRATETVINGVGIRIAPNGAHSVYLDINSKKPPMFIMEPPTIRIFNLNQKNENVVSHLSFVGKFDGPYPFYSDDGLLLD